MKKLVLFATVLLLSALSTQAQDMMIGPFVSAKAGINAGKIRDGRKTSVNFNGLPDIGVTYYLPFGKGSTTGLNLDLAYSTYSYGTIIVGTNGAKDINFDDALNFISLSPMLNANGFLLGFNIGIPSGGKETLHAYSFTVLGQTFSKPDTSASINSSDMNMMLELRIGGMFKLVDSKSGQLNLVLLGGYQLNGLAKNDTSDYNPHAASISLGLNYLFSLK